MCLMPMFTAKPGMLWKLGHSINEKMAGANVNLDQHFALVFTGRPDLRDKRPVAYSGRIAVSSSLKHDNQDLSLFSSTALFQQQVIVDAVPQRSKDMVVDTDCDEEAVPVSTDPDTAIKPQEK